jgi:hypothetical protein
MNSSLESKLLFNVGLQNMSVQWIDRVSKPIRSGHKHCGRLCGGQERFPVTVQVLEDAAVARLP